MTRLYLHAGRVRLRVLGVLLACIVFFGGLVLLGFNAFLATPWPELRRELVLVAALLAGIFVAAAAVSWRVLRPVAGLLVALRDDGVAGPAREEPARRATLRFPFVFAHTVVAACVAAIAIGAFVNLYLFRMDSRLVLGMTLATLSVSMAAATFMYIVCRALVRPIAEHFRGEQMPAGMVVSVADKVTLTTLALALATSVPIATICGRRLHVTELELAQRRASHLAEAIAYGATQLPSAALRDSLAATRLAGGARVRLTDYASATAAALPPGHAASHVEVSGVRDESTGDGSLALLVLSMLALSLGVGRLLGRNLALDVELVTSRIEAMAEPDAGPRVRPLIAGIPQFSDLRALAAAVNELLVRITEIHVTHFVAIEKTLAADRVKMQFLANVSHDLRSPLNAILGFSELLLREGAKLGARAHTTVSTIHRAGGELLRLIDEVLDIAKLEAGRISLQREDSLPALILNQAIQEVSRSGLRVGVHISAELQAGLPLAWVDPHRLQQAIEHILRFCGEQLERGEISVRVRTETLRQPTPEGCRKMLLVRIADAGRGIEEEDLARLFVGFRRKPGVRGLGLGLPLARAMIEMHGGTLQVFSVPGVGTTFAADIPVMQRKSVGRLRPVPV